LKVYLFALALCFVGCKNAIKNETESVLIASNEIAKEPLANNNTVVNSKEDFIGTWMGEAFDNEVGIYTTNFAFLFQDIKGDLISGKILYSDEIIPFETEILDNGKNFKINFKNIPEKARIRSCNIQIFKGDNIIKGILFINPYNDPDYPQKPEKYTIELVKKSFIYGMDNGVSSMFHDNEKKGKGYRIYKGYDKKGNIVQTKEERDGYLGTTDKILKINPSAKILTKEVVENLTKADLYILIQLVYAKHGMIFNDKSLSDYFLFHKWYVPIKENVENDLTEIEKENIDLLKRYEQNAKEYYQVFGR
jgi:hypothetical protein